MFFYDRQNIYIYIFVLCFRPTYISDVFAVVRAVVNFLVGICLFVLPSFVRSRLAYKFCCGCAVLVVVDSALAVAVLLLLLLLPAVAELLLLLVLLLLLSCCRCDVGQRQRQRCRAQTWRWRCALAALLLRLHLPFRIYKVICVHMRVCVSLSVRAYVFTLKLQAVEPGKQ